jgi:hypothetical protein
MVPESSVLVVSGALVTPAKVEVGVTVDMSGCVSPWTVVVVTLPSGETVLVSPALRSPLWMVRFGLFGPTYPDRLALVCGSARIACTESVPNWAFLSPPA